jgi:uncharacterized protein (DUF697 family)/tellurite resistance protein
MTDPTNAAPVSLAPAVSPAERDAVAAICLLAAFADGGPDDAERARIKGVMDSLAAPGAPEGVSGAVYQRVIFRQTDAAREAAAITTPELRRFAYEMAVGVCGADGVSTPAEKAFLAGLASALGLPAPEAAAVVEHVDLLTDAPAAAGGAALGVGSLPPPLPGVKAPAAPGASAADAEIESSILNYAVLNAALELLPQGLASAAIIPLQTKMVYEIGKRYGYPLDRGHVKDFLATVGVGLTSQFVEGFARRLVGGLIQNVGGRVVGRGLAGSLAGWGRTAAGAGVTFATTYALGQAARQYYAGGRSMSAIDLRGLFTRQMETARTAYEQYRPRVEEQARRINPAQLLSLVRGG